MLGQRKAQYIFSIKLSTYQHVIQLFDSKADVIPKLVCINYNGFFFLFQVCLTNFPEDNSAQTMSCKRKKGK